MNETKLLNDGIAALENKIVTVRELCEKQVLLFYRDELRRIRPCPENEQFQRPGKGIGGPRRQNGVSKTGLPRRSRPSD